MSQLESLCTTTKDIPHDATSPMQADTQMLSKVSIWSQGNGLARKSISYTLLVGNAFLSEDVFSPNSRECQDELTAPAITAAGNVSGLTLATDPSALARLLAP